MKILRRQWLLLMMGVFSLSLFGMLTGCGCSRDADAEMLRIALDIEDRDRYDHLFQLFTTRTGIEVRATYGEDISKLIGTRDEPDLIKTSTVVIRSMKSSLYDLTERIQNTTDISAEDYLPSVMDALTIEGRVYALPTSINTSLLYYNKDLFDASEAALREALNLSPEQSVYPQPDWTYSDYVTAGVVLSHYTVQPDGRRVYSQFGAETQLNWWGEWLVYLNQMGGSFYRSDSNQRRSGLDSTEAYEATSFYVRKAMGGPDEKFAPNAIESTQFSFLGGNVAMIFGGHMGDWFSYEALGLNWDIQVLPTPDDNPNARGGEISADAFGISVRSQNKDAAFDFLTLWTGEEGALAMASYSKIGALNVMETLLKENTPQGMPDIRYEALFMAASKAVTLPDEQDFSRLMREVVMAELYRLMYTGRGSETDVAVVLERIRQAIDTHYINRYGS